MVMAVVRILDVTYDQERNGNDHRKDTTWRMTKREAVTAV